MTGMSIIKAFIFGIFRFGHLWLNHSLLLPGLVIYFLRLLIFLLTLAVSHFNVFYFKYIKWIYIFTSNILMNLHHYSIYKEVFEIILSFIELLERPFTKFCYIRGNPRILLLTKLVYDGCVSNLQLLTTHLATKW